MNENLDLNWEALNPLYENLNSEDVDALTIIATLLNMPDTEFEIMRPVLQEVMSRTFAEPQSQMELVNSFMRSGLSVDDLLNHTDEIIDQICESKELELSDSKKDFLRYMINEVANSVAASSINPAHMVEIPVEICRDDARLPSYATDGSGAMDIYNIEEVTLKPGECKVIPIGIKVAIPHGYGLLIQPRSGLSRKLKLRIPNSPGLIDEDYHEEIGVIVENIEPPIKDIGIELKNGEIIDGTEFGSSLTIGAGERFAQMRLIEIPRVRWREVKSLGTFEQDHGQGFGSTGTN